ncbi:hypothetical protein AVEN_92532-1 [Araneus ventricosus]|uniref:Endonuclease/exonuclease/phosphatase domain-containing protein n=1 Tax=Araneus ventricosus TaxID=182803 RepID=A0A4Y2AJ76_ARAVE|nr:hypothetical protein AVEN_92532-1 [Araneus ventricosus]
MPRTGGCHSLLGSVVGDAVEPESLPMSCGFFVFHRRSQFIYSLHVDRHSKHFSYGIPFSGTKTPYVMYCKVCRIKDLIYEVHPVCIALQETYLKPADIAKIKRYSLVSKYNENESGRASGGVALLAFHDTPSSIITLHTNLQAVALRVMLSNLVTVCTLYLPPSTNVNDGDLDRLVDELPTPFYHYWEF